MKLEKRITIRQLRQEQEKLERVKSSVLKMVGNAKSLEDLHTKIIWLTKLMNDTQEYWSIFNL